MDTNICFYAVKMNRYNIYLIIYYIPNLYCNDEINLK